MSKKKLRDYVIATREVEGSGGSFTVRGLNTRDIAVVLQTHGPAIAKTFGDVIAQVKAGKKTTFTTEDTKEAIRQIIPQVPEVAVALIAMAADDYTNEGIEVAGRLPMGVQIIALQQVFEVTFESEAELKKLGELLLTSIAQMTGSLKKMQLPLSELGIGESDAA